MKISILAEGSTRLQRFIRHWGLSILVGDDILFDTFGGPNYVADKLKRSGVNIRRIKNIAISHDDWDHIGGLWKLLDTNRDATVYVCPHFKKEIKKKITESGAILVETQGVTEIGDDIYLSGELTGRRQGLDIPEQYLAIKKENGIVLITGCAHPGIIGIIQHAKSAFGSNVNVLIGGFHLKDHREQDAHDIILRIKSLGVSRVVPLHCTGPVAQGLFEKEFGADCVIPAEGQAIEV